MGLAQEYRGCYPTTFPIIDGKNHAGITIHSISAGIDDGPIYATNQFPLYDKETGKEVYDKCTDLALVTFKEIWPRIKSESIIPKNQTGNPVYHKRSDFPSHRINLDWPMFKIDRYVRALTFPPFPMPYFTFEGKKFEIQYV
jgi:methionyl-tRNA formyltransferase